MAEGDQSVSFSIEGTRLVIKIGTHCRALLPGTEVERLIEFLWNNDPTVVANQMPPGPPSLTLQAYRVVNS